MRGIPWLLGAVALAGVSVVAGACGGKAAGGTSSGDDGGAATVEAGPSACTSCQSDSDCSGIAGSSCVTVPAGSYCFPSCNSGADCASGTTCTPVESVANGSQVGACVPQGGVCGEAPKSDAAAPSACGNLVGPSTQASCQCPSGKTCGANGCRYQEYCDTTNNTCGPAPIGCGTPGTPYVGGTAPTGSVGATGGPVSRLYFAVVGDTRPANEDDTGSYPTSVITQIYTSVQALSPRPTFAIGTGDYQYANPNGSQGSTQVDLYMTARALYSGPLFPAMGNHECTGYTTSNCGQGNADGLTNNYNVFLSKMLAPISQTKPYYEVDIDAADGSWTSKFLFVAANAWDGAQSAWLTAAMSKTTTYTFLIRHESSTANTAPGVNPAESIMYGHPYTLSIVGHTHSYSHSSQREIIVGNGGAPLSGGVDYGFGMLSQQADGSIAVDMVDYTSGMADTSFHFAVKPDGSPAN
ncbi:MAG TPA: metallophosphoesterase [Polyangiaceae bacterium]